VFGEYVSIIASSSRYDDKSTVPLYYENRIPEVQLTSDTLNEDLEEIIENALLDEKQEEKLIREFAREYHIITRDSRLDRVAEDIVAHFAERGYQGKAMVVSVDKPTAARCMRRSRALERPIERSSRATSKSKGPRKNSTTYYYDSLYGTDR
jgi:type I restriction enzyme R subunit